MTLVTNCFNLFPRSILKEFQKSRYVPQSWACSRWRFIALNTTAQWWGTILIRTASPLPRGMLWVIAWCMQLKFAVTCRLACSAHQIELVPDQILARVWISLSSLKTSQTCTVLERHWKVNFLRRGLPNASVSKFAPECSLPGALKTFTFVCTRPWHEGLKPLSCVIDMSSVECIDRME